MPVIKSTSTDQHEILQGIVALYCPLGIEVDLTYGNGGFYKSLARPKHCFDIQPLSPFVVQADSRKVPLLDSIAHSVMFDPPFLTYVRQGREGNGSMIMANRFSGYWAYSELQEHYTETLKEAHRILTKKGVMIFKCQDIVHNHRLHPTHINVVDWAKGLFRLKDLFVLTANHRLPSPNRLGKQQHARIFHSYFLVLEKL